MAGVKIDGGTYEHGRPTLSARVMDDPRISKAQREALSAVIDKDPNACLVGLDAKMRPVIEANVSGPRRRTRWALLRNGEPTRAIEPLTEVWK